MEKQRKPLSRAILEALARRGGEPSRPRDVIDEALAATEPPLKGKTPRATAHGQIVALVKKGLVERPEPGKIRLAPRSRTTSKR